MSAISVPRPTDSNVSREVTQEADDELQMFLQNVLEKLKKDPTTITPDDARRLTEHFSASDKRMARLISAIETTAAAHDDIAEITHDTASLAGAGHASIHTIVEDLIHAIDKCPGDVTAEIFSLTQSAVTKMRKALGHNTAPHPELEAELQAEFARIEQKVKQGTVTKDEANHLHSLEARAHGHTEKGGLTAVAQSIATKRERQASLSDASNIGNQGLNPQDQSHKDREANLRRVEFALRPKIENEPDHVTKEDASLLVSRERRAHQIVEKDSLAAHAQSLADKHETKGQAVSN